MSTINDRRGSIRHVGIYNHYTGSEDLGDAENTSGTSTQRPPNSTASPRRHDARWWVRWPAKAVHYVERLPKFIYFTLTLSYINILLLFLPVAIAAQALGWRAQLIVAFNALSLCPLAFLVAFFADALSSGCTELVSYFVESLLVNAVWLVLGICAVLREEHEFMFIQSAIAGSIISRNFLGLGGAFLVGGINHREQRFNEVLSGTVTSLMMVGFIPFSASKILGEAARKAPHLISETWVLWFAHGSAIVMIVWYLLYVVFRVWTHADDFRDVDQVGSHRSSSRDDENAAEANEETALVSRDVRRIERFPKRFAFWFLVLALAATAACSISLLDSIDDLAPDFFISKTMLAVIILPLLINLSENSTIYHAAWENEMDRAVLIATTSVIHMNLVVFPVLILLGWATQQPVTLEFSGPGLVIFGLGVWLTGLVLQDGKSNYLEGLICIGLYVIFATMTFLLPGNV